MKVLTLINNKGGVGKTTLALHLAEGAALRDLRVLLIDSDPQGHCAQQLGIEKSAGLVRLLVDHAEWRTVLREPEAARWLGREATIGRLLLLPGSVDTRLLQLHVELHPLALRDRLTELEGLIDLVVIDTPPTPSLSQHLVTMASDYVLYPTLCQALSLYGLGETDQQLAEQNAARREYGLPPITLLGVVPTMFRRDTNAHLEGLKLLEKHFGETLVLEPMPLRTVWVEREYQGLSLFAYDPVHEATQEMRVLVRRALTTMQIEGKVEA